MRAWDVVWGHGAADVVIENSYAIVSERVITAGDVARSAPTGTFSLGYPRKRRGRGDQRAGPARHGGRWPTCATRSSSTTSRSTGSSPASTTSTATTRRHSASARLLIETASRTARRSSARRRRCASRARRPAGLARDREEHRTADRRRVGRLGRQLLVQRRRRRIPVESLKTADVSAGAALRPAAVHRDRRRDVRGRATTSSSAVDDLFAGDEGIGQLTGVLSLRGELLTAGARSRLPAPRRVRLGPHRADDRDGRRADAAVRRHVARSVPPLLRAAAVAVHHRRGRRHDPRRRRARRRRSPGRRGARRAARPEAVRLPADATRAPIELSLDQHVLEIDQLQLDGRGHGARRSAATSTSTAISSTCRPSGDANLGILQGFFRDIRSSRRAPRSRRR